MRRALRRWIKADTGAFTQTTTFPGGSMRVKGVYRLSSRVSSMDSVVDAGGKRFKFKWRAIKSVTYMNTRSWPAEFRRCWLRVDAEAVQASTGLTMAPGTGGLPGNAIALSYARGAAVDPADPHVIIGTVDLVTAATMFGSGMVRLFDDMTMEGTVNARFAVLDGDISRWGVAGVDLRNALYREGLLDGLTNEVEAGLNAFSANVEYRDLGSAEVDVSAPDPALQMTPAQMDSRQGCSAAQ